ncbi:MULTISPECIES: hypothetical protein [unclassified Rhizobium]|uniref:hypothetical protein n=1 Tax=unclassified Rhizobium TaxID=2613769 RepID=UPI00247ACF71|nr:MULTISPECIES: hypothetical protein [unclassified Rhizobium]MDH7801304.1 hypothetical protein [Rhizobium sp. AN70]
MASITVKTGVAKSVRYLKADCGVRYWEDAEVNGVEDEDGNIPCRNGDSWQPVIDLNTGKIEGWPEGTTADLHYKVCDAGVYTLLDENREAVKQIDGYVPKIMCPGGSGYGDYVIMKIGADGLIDNFNLDLGPFEVDE